MYIEKQEINTFRLSVNLNVASNIMRSFPNLLKPLPKCISLNGGDLSNGFFTIIVYVPTFPIASGFLSNYGVN